MSFSGIRRLCVFRCGVMRIRANFVFVGCAAGRSTLVCPGMWMVAVGKMKLKFAAVPSPALAVPASEEVLLRGPSDTLAAFLTA
jgi:hypothetical protein